jgi:membrane-bound metal-dependent hydrolase YbcI (DUF457 family)
VALCLSHTAAGYLAYEAVRPQGAHRPGLLVGAVVLANAPDFDFLPGIVLGRPGAFHRGVTHTLAAVVVVAAVVVLAGRLRDRSWRTGARVAAWSALTYASHLLLDFLTIDARAPYGARFLWPVSDAYYLAPWTPLREIVIDPSGRFAFLQSLVAPHTVGVWLLEVAVLASVVSAVQLARLRSSAVELGVRRLEEGP